MPPILDPNGYNRYPPSINSGDAKWGDITGTLSSQNDLQSELDNKASTTDLDSKVDNTEKGAANGVATLNGTTKIPAAQLDSSTINHNLTTNYNADQHVGHGGVLINAGVGVSVTGLGDITESRTINLDVATQSDRQSQTVHKMLDASAIIDEDLMTSDADDRIPTQQSVVAYIANQTAGGVTYRGVMPIPADMTTNTTGNAYADASSSYLVGDMFVAGSSGVLTLSDGNINVNQGDALIINTATPNASIAVAMVDDIASSNSVQSVHGRTGVVVPVNGDYTANQITNTPNGNISAVTVQTAIDELDTEKASLNSNVTFEDITAGRSSGNGAVLDVALGGNADGQVANFVNTNSSNNNEVVLIDQAATGGAAALRVSSGKVQVNELGTPVTGTAANTLAFLTVDSSGNISSVNTTSFVQSGTFTSNVDGAQTVNFPTAFPNEHDIHVITQWGEVDAEISSDNIRVIDANTTNISFQADRANSVQGSHLVTWIAVNRTLLG